MAKQPKKRAEKLRKEQEAMNHVLNVFFVGIVAEFYLLTMHKRLTGTAAQFDIEVDAAKKEIKITTDKAYAPIAGDLTIGADKSESTVVSVWTVYVDGVAVEAQAYNIGGTMEQSLSLLELFAMLEDILGIRMEYVQLPPRQSDQKVFVADIEKIHSRIGWMPQVSAREGVEAMVQWVKGMGK